MVETDIFVGAVSIIVGGVCLAAAIFNWPWYFEMRSSRWIERIGGRAGARLFVALLGLGLIVLGGAIALGFLSRSGGSSTSRLNSTPGLPGRNGNTNEPTSF